MWGPSNINQGFGHPNLDKDEQGLVVSHWLVEVAESLVVGQNDP